MEKIFCENCKNEFQPWSPRTKFCSKACFGISRRQPIEKRFMKFVKKTKSCWLWTGAKHGKGYGHFQIGQTNKKAHRISYELFNGPFDKNLHVLHSCDNPSCVNPAHLSLGTNADNVLDSELKGRRAKKIPFSEIIHMRALKEAGVRPSEIARVFGLETSYVSRITLNKLRRYS